MLKVVIIFYKLIYLLTSKIINLGYIIWAILKSAKSVMQPCDILYEFMRKCTNVLTIANFSILA